MIDKEVLCLLSLLWQQDLFLFGALARNLGSKRFRSYGELPSEPTGNQLILAPLATV